jgi:YbgC/YbaW family acyl-CoA thioester hydrolase
MSDLRSLNRESFRCIVPVRPSVESVIQCGWTAECLPYLLYVDTAVSGYWRTLALPYHDTMHALGGDLYVRKATLEYLGSARYDDVLQVGLRCARIGNSSLTFQAAVFRGEQCLVHGEIVYVFADPATQTSRPVPEGLRQALNGFEAGEPMVDVRLGGWDTLGAAAQQVRRPVFVDEQGIAPELVVDEADATAVHAVAFNRFGVPVAAGRLLQPARGLAQVGRMATLATVRGGQLGRAVLHTLMQAARERGDVAMVLHAQSTAVGFYERHGFTAEGEGFMAAGLPHQAMRRML